MVVAGVAVLSLDIPTEVDATARNGADGLDDRL
jgi:hypothetical protein